MLAKVSIGTTQDKGPKRCEEAMWQNVSLISRFHRIYLQLPLSGSCFTNPAPRFDARMTVTAAFPNVPSARQAVHAVSPATGSPLGSTGSVHLFC